MKILMDIWQNLILGLKTAFYIIAVIFLSIGIYALFNDGVIIGVLLIVLNTLMIAAFRKLDQKADVRFEQNFDEMVRSNRGKASLRDHSAE